jgi:hypothetical protein
MKKTATPPSASTLTEASPSSQSGQDAAWSSDWPVLPVETEVYILPDGRVVIADLPSELAPLVQALGEVEPCAVLDPSAEAKLAPPS